MKKILRWLKYNNKLLYKTCILTSLYSFVFIIGMMLNPFENNKTIIATIFLFILIFNTYLFIKNYKYNEISIKIFKKVITAIVASLIILIFIIYLEFNFTVNVEKLDFLSIFTSTLDCIFISLLIIPAILLYIFIKKIDKKQISILIYKTGQFTALFTFLSSSISLLMLKNLPIINMMLIYHYILENKNP